MHNKISSYERTRSNKKTRYKHRVNAYRIGCFSYGWVNIKIMENTLLTEIMVLRDKNAELVEALSRCHSLMEDASKYYKSKALKKQIEIIESLINSNITE